MCGESITAIWMDRGDVLQCVARFAESMRPGGGLPCPSNDARCGAELVGKLPDRIARCGIVTEGMNAWAYLEPRAGCSPSAPHQILIYLPAGRYLVDTFDTVSHTCIARESAAGNPIVAGLADVPGPILLWIRPVGGPEGP